MNILAIDPGPTHSAWVLYDPVARAVLNHGKDRNDDVRRALYEDDTPLVIEGVASYGRPVGMETFNTCIWIGRFIEAIPDPGSAKLIYRRDVKRHLCGTENKVNDAVIRQRLIDLWGGKAAAIGRKASPGPLYGLHADEWQALALAVTCAEIVPNGTRLEVMDNE